VKKNNCKRSVGIEIYTNEELSAELVKRTNMCIIGFVAEPTPDCIENAKVIFNGKLDDLVKLCLVINGCVYNTTVDMGKNE
jgi:hypothetical protein